MIEKQIRYEHSEKDKINDIKSVLQEEYSEYLNNLNNEQIREIAKSDHFQLYKIEGVKWVKKFKEC